MSEATISIKSAFTSNRAEELGLDVWDDFVLPLFFNDLKLNEAKKARRIIGGRGCGKTMLLRYLAHHSQFSTNRKEIHDSDVNNIGLYWRADTNFLPMLTKQGLDEEMWMLVFKHYLTLVTSIEILKSIKSIEKSSYEYINDSDIKSLNFDELADYDSDLSGSFEKLQVQLKRKLRECESAVHNPATLSNLKKLPDSFIVNGLIPTITEQLSVLSNTAFVLYIDEYENLLEYQQKTINTKIKHGQSPLIYHIAMKRNGMETSETLGEESIQGIADYREIDLDKYLTDGADFELFSAEILLHRLSKTDLRLESFDAGVIKSLDKITYRQSEEYSRSTINKAKQILPTFSQAEMAKNALEQKSILSKLEKEIESIFIKKHYSGKIKPSDFIKNGLEQASIIIPSILSRDSNQIDNVYAELVKLEKGDSNKFSSGWLANNFIGCFLRVYRSYNRPCPFYAGFLTYVKLSRGNIRHFLELLNAAVLRAPNSVSEISIDIENQSFATRAASEEILNEASSYGRLGTRLQKFIYSLGHIFEFSQMRLTQSEPEVNHFSIKGGYSKLNDEDIAFIKEAEKWGVLYKEKSTKEKDKSNPDSVEWVLNPIYSPFFFISYRKKRKIEFTAEQFGILHNGSEDVASELEKSYMTKWGLSSEEKPYNYKLI